MITKQRFTPGPWLVLPDPVWRGKHPCHDARFIATSDDLEIHYEDGAPAVWRFKDNGEIICAMHDAENQKANARLIASAPELLEAVQAMLKDNHELGELSRPVADQARAALLAATGKDAL